ncbi:Rhodanese-like domain-containing protein 8 [Hibiscus syriacus]|uniref:Rhodanese-like domain-containing protein 8 n=1 Tax=Hibiscus syriacus TaxID=106335 RepID=A0A6A3C099_HIBSY|nr:rhodanese-like domain-containing protein 8, chloroplastic isoform X2 [Hibiscus syriacus]KAE8721687.1 Rhodanese-like domain-containing protein 8 [Hibiscus syriacus]
MGGWSAHCLSIPHSLILGHYSKSLSKAAAHPHYFCFHYCLPIKSRKDPCAISIRFCASTSESHNVDEIRQAEPETDDFVVVNFYRFVFIKEPQHEVSKHLTFLKGLDIHGRIYINEQGINAQYSGPSKHAFAYVEWLKEDQKFSDILVQTSPSDGHAFPKLKLRYKPSLVQLEGGISHLPLLDPSMRATAIAPSEWRKRLEAANNNDTTSNTNSSSNYILLDVRNGYEWDIGHFHGAHRPDVDCFRSTSFGTSPTQGVASDQLSQVDKEKTDILMYCTGGIRCDVYSTILRQQGFQNLYTLKGGVSHYLKTEGPVKWIGNLFTFDSRLSLPPSAYNRETMIESGLTRQAFNSEKFAKCYVCDSKASELRHRNCANLDCNLLFLCCANCVMDLRGCCCHSCTIAPRRRPVLPGFQRYKKWHVYRDQEIEARAQ